MDEAIFAVEIVFLCFFVGLFGDGFFVVGFLFVVDDDFWGVLGGAAAGLSHSSMRYINRNRKC